MDELRNALRKDYIAGLTLSGGDPLHPNNIDKITEIVYDISRDFPDKTIWLYTGALFEDVSYLSVV